MNYFGYLYWQYVENIICYDFISQLTLYYDWLSDLWYSEDESFVHTVVFLLTVAVIIQSIDLPWKM